MNGGQPIRMMIGAGVVWVSDLLMQTVLAEVVEEWTNFLGR